MGHADSPRLTRSAGSIEEGQRAALDELLAERVANDERQAEREAEAEQARVRVQDRPHASASSPRRIWSSCSLTLRPPGASTASSATRSRAPSRQSASAARTQATRLSLPTSASSPRLWRNPRPEQSEAGAERLPPPTIGCVPPLPCSAAVRPSMAVMTAQCARYHCLVVELRAHANQRVRRRPRAEPEHHRQPPVLEEDGLGARGDGSSVQPAGEAHADTSTRRASHMHDQLASAQRLRDMEFRRSRCGNVARAPGSEDGTTTFVRAPLAGFALPAALLSHTAMLQLPGPGTVTVAGPVAGAERARCHCPRSARRAYLVKRARNRCAALRPAPSDRERGAASLRRGSRETNGRRWRAVVHGDFLRGDGRLIAGGVDRNKGERVPSV